VTECKICSSTSVVPFSRATLLKRHIVEYFRCSECGFICTEEPYWLKEAYSEAITGSDVGLVRRNCQLSVIAGIIIRTFFGHTGTFLDFAGGYGLFVRLMRDRGFDFRWYDAYCNNLFAQGFEGSLKEGSSYRLMTAFEVFEHLANPLEDIENMLKLSRSILFSTELIPATCPKPDEWWYYGPEHGQHISFYSRQSLQVIADKHNLNLYSNGSSMHLLTEKKIPAWLFFTLARYKTAAIINPLLPTTSLLPADFASITSRELH